MVIKAPTVGSKLIQSSSNNKTSSSALHASQTALDCTEHTHRTSGLTSSNHLTDRDIARLLNKFRILLASKHLAHSFALKFAWWSQVDLRLIHQVPTRSNFDASLRNVAFEGEGEVILFIAGEQISTNHCTRDRGVKIISGPWVAQITTSKQVRGGLRVGRL
uniref:AlNc14C564G12157 protein n=1 Tax=Albugo laibachii Nc14 TaxID=890382 RepID=F0X164_9STRA|nr:AlNc14C564G12157 [Albugo laibachii Nc14]|eukprot:CCA27521.1 AlNc14C564G12157 [Albugo laibachii Nc14]